MRRLLGAFVGIAIAASVSVGRDATALKADIASILPSGKQARFAYLKGGSPVAFPTEAAATAVYGVSSTDGVIKRIYPATGTANYTCVNFTADGSRFIVYNKGTSEVHVVNWSGTLVRKFSVGGMLLDYWLNPADNTEWAVFSSSGVKRININSPGTAVAVVNSDAGDDGALISDDGTKVVMYNSNGAAGLATVLPGSGFTAHSGDGGCWVQMRAGSPIQYSHNPSGHMGPALYNAGGSSAGTIATSAALTTWCNADKANRSLVGSCTHPENDYASDGHRWSRDRDFLSFFCEASKMNPILWRHSDSKWIYIEDNLTCTFCGDMDAVFAASFPGGTEIAQKVSLRWPALAQGIQDAKSYSINGRLLSTATAGVRGEALLKGVVIHQSTNGVVTKICK